MPRLKLNMKFSVFGTNSFCYIVNRIQEKMDTNRQDEMKEIYSELGLDVLNNVAGGREMRESEREEHMEIFKRYRQRQMELLEMKAYDEQIALRNRFFAAAKRWTDDIQASSEDSEDIHFADYFEL